jgi:hypothetical protein
MTPEAKLNRQNPIVDTLKRIVGFQAYQQSNIEGMEDYPKNRFGRVSANVMWNISQLTMPMTTEILLNLGKEERQTILTKSAPMVPMALLLDFGIPIGAIVMSISG